MLNMIATMENTMVAICAASRSALRIISSSSSHWVFLVLTSFWISTHWLFFVFLLFWYYRYCSTWLYRKEERERFNTIIASHTGYCPYSCENRTILIEFFKVPVSKSLTSGYKRKNFDCSFKNDCPYCDSKRGCSLYQEATLWFGASVFAAHSLS